MRHIDHTPTVPFVLIRAVRNGVQRWSNFTDKKSVTDLLNPIQKCLCAYCQIRLDSNVGSHIDHIFPKSKYPQRTFSWKNLVLSCTNSQNIGNVKKNGGVSCGHSKGRVFSRLLVLPTSSSCDRYFKYEAGNGCVSPADGLDKYHTMRADYTIKTLNLNSSRLCRERKDMLKEGYKIINALLSDKNALNHFIDCDLAEVNGKLPSFITARQQHFGVFL